MSSEAPQLIEQTVKPLRPFAHLAGRKVTCRPPRALRRRMRTPEKLTISQWANKYRRVTEIDAKPGRWRGEMVPHTEPIMDDIGKPWVRQVWICLPERGAKTQILTNTVCHRVDQGSQAGNIFWLMPTEHDAKKAMGERIIPVFRARDDNGRPGRIARYLSGAVDDTTRGTIRFNHGIRLFPAWANSPGSMAAYFGRLNIADECDKFPLRTSEGTDPITLFLKRARDDRHRSKYVFASTPAGKFIYKGTMGCQQVKTWAMKCPDCGEYVLPGEEHLYIPDGTTFDSVDGAELGLVCPACSSIWDEDAREAAYLNGRAEILKGADVARPSSIGWHAPSWIFPTVPLQEIVTAKLKADAGDHTAKSAYANGYKVADLEVETKERQEDAILLLRDDRPAGTVPTWADLLEISIDTQDRGFWYRLRAWKFGLEMESALVQCGFVDSFAALDRLIYGRSGEGFEHLAHRASYFDAEGREYHIEAGIIDSAGHRTSEVYAWTRRPGSIVIPAKGASGRKTQPVTVSKIDLWPGTNKPIPGGLRLYHIDTHFHKDALAGKLAITAGDPGSFWLHSGYSAQQLQELEKDPSLKLPNSLEDYAKQMCVEFRNEKGLWECPDGKDNHLFDCESNGYALALYIGVPHRASEKEAPPSPPPPPPQQTSTTGRSLPSWFQSRR